MHIALADLLVGSCVHYRGRGDGQHERLFIKTVGGGAGLVVDVVCPGCSEHVAGAILCPRSTGAVVVGLVA